MKPALFSVLCEIKEKTGKTLRPAVGLETPEVGSELLLRLSSGELLLLGTAIFDHSFLPTS